MNARFQLKSALDALSATLREARGPKFDGPAIQAATTLRGGFQPSPIEPSWIQEGSPSANAVTLTLSGDELLSSGLWECAAGKFKFIHRSDEIVHILEGEVTVSQGGAAHTLRAGHVAYFPAGLTTHWDVPRYVKKFCVHRSGRRSLLGRLRSRIGV